MLGSGHSPGPVPGPVPDPVEVGTCTVTVPGNFHVSYNNITPRQHE
jgi:hypothetical protein